MIKTITSSSKTQSHQPTGSSQSFDNCQFIDRSTANYQQIIDSNQPTFLSNFNDISIPYLKTSSTGVFTPGPVGTVIGLQNKSFTGQHLQDKSFQTAAVGKPRHGDEVHGIQASQQKYSSQHLIQDQGVKKNKGEQNQSEVSDVNQIKALRNLISSMQSNGANDYNQHPLPLKNILPKSSVLSDTGNCGLRVPQGVYKEGYITEDVFYSDLSKLTNSRPSDYNSVTLSSSQQCNGNAFQNNLNCMSSSLHQSNFNQVTSIYQSHQDYLSFPNTSKCFTPSSNEQTIHNLDSYQTKIQSPIAYLNGGLQQKQVLQDSQTSSYLQELVDQSTPIDINSTLKQLINQLNQNPHSQKSSNNLQEQQTINEQGIANFQARNENQQQLKNHILRNLSQKSQKKQVSLKCPQSDYEKNEHIRKRDAKQILKNMNDNYSDDSKHNPIKHSKIIDDKIHKSQKMNAMNETDNQQIKNLTDKNFKEDNKMLYDLIEHKNTKRNSNISQLACQNNNNVSKQKYQMVDKSSELKKRRLQLSSFRSNPTFHTSGNRFVPTMPRSILGAPITTKNNKQIQI